MTLYEKFMLFCSLEICNETLRYNVYTLCLALADAQEYFKTYTSTPFAAFDFFITWRKPEGPSSAIWESKKTDPPGLGKTIRPPSALEVEQKNQKCMHAPEKTPRARKGCLQLSFLEGGPRQTPGLLGWAGRARARARAR